MGTIKRTNRFVTLLFLTTLVFLGCSKDDDSGESTDLPISFSVTSVVLNEISNFEGPCPQSFEINASVSTDGPLTITYSWLRSNEVESAEETIEFTEAGSKNIALSWTFGESGASYLENWVQLKLKSPEEILSNRVEFDLQCETANSLELTMIAPEGPIELLAGEQVEFSFDYKTNEVNGVRIFGRPFTNGDPTPDYAAHASPLHPLGEGSGTGFFTINGTESVDQIRFQMWNDDQTELLLELFVDVDYSFIEHSLIMTSITPESPAELLGGEQVEFTFDYKTSEADGVRIFGRPFTNGSPTPGYAAHASGIYASGTGDGSGFFTINGTESVDQIRFQMLNADQSELLLEFFVDVDYSFTGHSVSMTSVTPESPAELLAGEQVQFSFDYFTVESGGVRIFGRPFTNGSPTPGYGAHGSGVYATGNGNGSGFFTINGTQPVDQIRFQMLNADQSELLYETFVDVDYEFKGHSISVTSITPEQPAELLAGNQVQFSFDYFTIESDGVRIFGRPFTNGSLTPGYGAHGSGVYATGEGTGNGFFTISGTQPVDQIRFQMWNPDQSELLYEVFIDVEYNFVTHSVVMTSISPEFPATLSPGDQIEFDFEYKTIEAGGVRIFGRPFTNGSLTPGYGAHGSGIYAAGEGNGSGFFTINGSQNVDQIRFQILNADQSVLLYEVFVDVEYTFE